MNASTNRPGASEQGSGEGFAHKNKTDAPAPAGDEGWTLRVKPDRRRLHLVVPAHSDRRRS